MLPRAQQASSTPAYALAPCSPEKATVATSAAANIEPRAQQTTARGTTHRHGIGGRAAVSWSRGCGSGWVSRWAAR